MWRILIFVEKTGTPETMGAIRRLRVRLVVTATLVAAALTLSGHGGVAIAADSFETLAASGAISLGATPVRVVLERPAGAASSSLVSRLERIGAHQKVYLLVYGLRARSQPGVLYHLYLDLPAGAVHALDNPHHIGTINFFHAPPPANSTSAPHAASTPAFSFEITPQLRALHMRSLLTHPTSVTIVPGGVPAKNAQAVVGKLRLVVV